VIVKGCIDKESCRFERSEIAQYIEDESKIPANNFYTTVGDFK
jgi:hypothetical protein